MKKKIFVLIAAIVAIFTFNALNISALSSGTEAYLSGSFHVVPLFNDSLTGATSADSVTGIPINNIEAYTKVTQIKSNGATAYSQVTYTGVGAIEAYSVTCSKLAGVIRGTGSHRGTSTKANLSLYPYQYINTIVYNPNV